MLPRRITIHCSGLAWGTLEGIRRFHTAAPPRGRGWSDIGYHFVITNGDPGVQRHDGVDRSPEKAANGKIWEGRPIDRPGAGVLGENEDNIHVVLVGLPGAFTRNQLIGLLELTAHLCRAYDIDPGVVRGHSEYDPLRACPGIDMRFTRAAVRALLRC